MSKVDSFRLSEVSEFDSEMIVLYDSVKDKVGNYTNSELLMFKDKLVVFIARLLDVLEEFSYDVDDKIDVIGEKMMELYDKIITLREMQDKNRSSSEKIESVFDKLKPMVPVDDMEELEVSSQMGEFKLEDYDNESYRVGYTKKKSRRGSLSIFLAILISVVVIGVIVFVKIINV